MTTTDQTTGHRVTTRPRYDLRAVVILAGAIIFVAAATNRPWHVLSAAAMAAAALALTWALNVLRETAQDRATGLSPSRPTWQRVAAWAVFVATGIAMIAICYTVTLGRL